MEETVSIDIFAWLHELCKPYNMSILNFINQFENLNSLVPYCPGIKNVNPMELTEPEQMTILHKARPK
eukprot:3022899-Ditylum_brightwellii.AAC.1